jgi:hypothetical protein
MLGKVCDAAKDRESVRIIIIIDEPHKPLTGICLSWWLRNLVWYTHTHTHTHTHIHIHIHTRSHAYVCVSGCVWVCVCVCVLACVCVCVPAEER